MQVWLVELKKKDVDKRITTYKLVTQVNGSICSQLRIDNSRHSVICTFGLTSGTMSCISTYYMSKNRAHFFLSDNVNDMFVRFDFIHILV